MATDPLYVYINKDFTNIFTFPEWLGVALSSPSTVGSPRPALAPHARGLCTGSCGPGLPCGAQAVGEDALQTRGLQASPGPLTCQLAVRLPSALGWSGPTLQAPAPRSGCARVRVSVHVRAHVCARVRMCACTCMRCPSCVGGTFVGPRPPPPAQVSHVQDRAIGSTRRSVLGGWMCVSEGRWPYGSPRTPSRCVVRLPWAQQCPAPAAPSARS